MKEVLISVDELKRLEACEVTLYAYQCVGVFTDEAYFTTESGSIYSNEYKPYLLPLSSMTDEQEEEYNDLNCYELGCFPHTEEALDYLIKNHFDYRGLIEKELAIDATNLNIY